MTYESKNYRNYESIDPGIDEAAIRNDRPKPYDYNPLVNSNRRGPDLGTARFTAQSRDERLESHNPEFVHMRSRTTTSSEWWKERWGQLTEKDEIGLLL